MVTTLRVFDALTELLAGGSWTVSTFSIVRRTALPLPVVGLALRTLMVRGAVVLDSNAAHDYDRGRRETPNRWRLPLQSERLG